MGGPRCVTSRRVAVYLRTAGPHAVRTALPHAMRTLPHITRTTLHVPQGNPIPTVASALNASHVHPYNLVETASGKRVALCGLLDNDDLGLTTAWVDVLSDLTDAVSRPATQLTPLCLRAFKPLRRHPTARPRHHATTLPRHHTVGPPCAGRLEPPPNGHAAGRGGSIRSDRRVGRQSACAEHHGSCRGHLRGA